MPPNLNVRRARFFYPLSTGTCVGGGAEASGKEERAGGAPETQPRPSTAPTLADLAVLHGAHDRLLRVAEVAEHLDVCNTTVYRLCGRGELRHVWIGNSIRIRPDDLRTFLDGQTAPGGKA